MIKKILVASSFTLLVLSGCTSKDEVSIVKKDNKYGVIDNTGKSLVNTEYEELTWFDDSKNKNLKLNHPNYFNFHWFHNYAGNEYAIAKKDGKFGIIDKENKMLVKPMYDSITKLFNGYSIIEKDGKFGYLNEDLELVKKTIYDEAKEFLDEATFVKASNLKWACITKDMAEKEKAVYDEVYNFNNTIARVKKENKWGYVNNSCEELVKPIYEYAYDFSNGIGKVIKDGKITFVNKEGKELTKNIYKSASNF